MMYAFVAGELLRDPEKRQTKNGNDYATALLRAGEDALVSVTTFDSTLVERLLGLKKGEPLSVSGRLAVSAYLDKQGKPKAGLQVTVTELMTAPARTAKADSKDRPARRNYRKPGARHEPAPELDDAIPW